MQKNIHIIHILYCNGIVYIDAYHVVPITPCTIQRLYIYLYVYQIDMSQHIY